MVIKLVKTEIENDDHLTSIFFHPEQYKDLTYIGRGSFGKVVAAKDSVRNCCVAIKKIEVRYEQIRFSHARNLLREVVILRYAKNPQIVELRSVYMDLQSEKVPESIYIVTEYCGENLPMYMARMGNRVSLEDAAKIVYNIARGLNFLHELEVYHRDLKPGNICIDMSDEKFPAKIIDLGYARKKPRVSDEITRKLATLCYRSPENLLGLKYKESQDVWSLGCILGYLVSSQHIFRYTKLDVMEDCGTLKNILWYLGNPCEAFMNDLNDENQGDINRYLFNFLKSQDTEKGKGFYELLPRNDEDRKRNEALQLMTGMLRWYHKDRMCVQDIMKSDFVAEYREQSLERLPVPKLCTMIKSILDENENDIREYEKNKDYNGLIKDYLYNRIAEDFGWDEDLKDYYPYHPRSGSRRLALLQNLTTLAVISTVAGVVYNYRQHDSFSWKTFFSGAALVLTLSAVKRVLRC